LRGRDEEPDSSNFKISIALPFLFSRWEVKHLCLSSVSLTFAFLGKCEGYPNLYKDVV
jgi:hypothetical protein